MSSNGDGDALLGPERSYMIQNRIERMNKTNYMTKYDDKYRENQDDLVHKYANIDIHNFLLRIEKFELNVTDPADLPPFEDKHVRSYGSYIGNYFFWMFCCTHNACKFIRILCVLEMAMPRLKCYQDAVGTLQQFDIVVVSEWLNDYRMQMWVNKKVGDGWNKEMFVGMRLFRIHIGLWIEGGII